MAFLRPGKKNAAPKSKKKKKKAEKVAAPAKPSAPVGVTSRVGVSE